MTTSIQLTPIAHVRSPFETNTPSGTIQNEQLEIVIKPDLISGLMGLEEGSDILVLFYLDQIQPDQIDLQLRPCHNPDNPIKGVFATRTQFRPNKIAASVAHIEAISENVITVTRLDALNGTPVLDIKPYTPIYDQDTQQQQFKPYEVSSLQEARDVIDLMDTELIRLLGIRATFVHQVVRFKNNETEIVAIDRYNEVMRTRREMAEQAGLNPDVIEEMYRLLVDNFIKEEMEILKQKQAGS